MHINSERLVESLTESEALHLIECTECKLEREKLLALKISANQIELMLPPRKLKNAVIKNDLYKAKNNYRPFVWAGGIAASVLFSVIGLVTYQQLNIQQELVKLTLSNQLLESQLKEMNQNHQFTSDMLNQVLLAEQYMADTNDGKQLLYLLKRRQEAIQAMVEVATIKEIDNVISL